MSAQAAKLLEDALKLPQAERADLASCLFASLDRETCQQIDPTWDAEIERRLDAIDANQATLISWEEARKSMNEA